LPSPASPSEIGEYDTPGEALDVAVVGAHTYVADAVPALLPVSAW
jgi:hypothetical protein